MQEPLAPSPALDVAGSEQPLSTLCRTRGVRGLPFDVALKRGGYAWWYIDAESEDGAHQLTAIVFVGNVFSPYYARTKEGDPWQHVAINVSLTGRQSGWAFVEGAVEDKDRSSDRLALGQSRVSRDGDGNICIDVAAPRTAFDRSIVGTVRLSVGDKRAPAAPHLLAREGEHLWWPVQPNAEVEVDFARPRLHWRGRAYHDTNWGQAPLAQTLRSWHWQRTQTPSGTSVYYAGVDRAGAAWAFKQVFAQQGDASPKLAPAETPRVLHRTRWGIVRRAFGSVRSVSTLLDAPFYARTRLVDDEGHVSMQESLDLDRWRRPFLRFLLRFRLRRLRSQSGRNAPRLSSLAR